MFVELAHLPAVPTMSANSTALYPHLAPHDDGAEQLLAAESRQLLVDLTPSLSRLLELVPHANADAMLPDCTPQLCLKFSAIYRHGWTRAEIPEILNAFSRLATHSRRLDPYPVLKMRFWLAVLQSEMAHTVTHNVEKHEFMEPSFPEFVVDFGGFKGDPPSFTVDDALEDALVAFMTTPPTPPTRGFSPLSFGFVFAHCDQRVASLECIERFLARSFASATRQFDVRMLEISDEQLMLPELEVLARIVRKCVREYGVHELRLDSIIPQSAGYPRSDYVFPKTTPPPVMEMARDVFGIDARLPVLASRQQQQDWNSPHSLRKLSMNTNYFCLEFFATRFSALRYGCSLQEDTTTYLAQEYRHWTQHEGDEKDYWRWLAFGLFYPRPRRFRHRLRLHHIGQVEHTPLSFQRYAKTVKNPAAELIFHGKNNRIAPATELMVCVVKAGARVDVFQTGRHEAPEWTDVFPAKCELEAIYERASDGAVCVVVPGVGLGWVQAESVERIEREPLCGGEQDGLFAGDLGCRPTSFGKSDRVYSSMKTMVETFGRQFHALRFTGHCFKRGFLPTVLASCVNLTHLTLSELNLSVEDCEALLDVLRGDRLQALNLKLRKSNSAFPDRVLAVLGDVERPAALRQLRLQALNDSQVDALHTVLQTNSTLAEVYATPPNWRVDPPRPLSGLGSRRELAQQRAEAIDRMNAAFHGQLLRYALSIETKLALLSVVKAKRASGWNLAALEPWLLSKIFTYAADLEVRRRIVWCDLDGIKPHGFH